MSPLYAFFESPIQWLVVAMVALLLFGNRLPSLMRSLGQGVTEFKKGLEGVDDKPKQVTDTKKADELPPPTP